MYRYRDNAGSTRTSLDRLKYLDKLGKLLYVKGYFYFGRYGTTHSGVLVRGANGSVRFNGFGWGYGGAGPRGLVQLLEKLGIPKEQREQIAFKKYSWNDNTIGEKWRVNLV